MSVARDFVGLFGGLGEAVVEWASKRACSALGVVQDLTTPQTASHVDPKRSVSEKQG